MCVVAKFTTQSSKINKKQLRGSSCRILKHEKLLFQIIFKAGVVDLFERSLILAEKYRRLRELSEK